jgi:hypothetical protein
MAASIEEKEWGQTEDGSKVVLYTLSTGNGAVARFMSYGATLVELRAPDRRGVYEDIVLGFDSLSPYLGEHPYFGVIVGRVANRIAGAKFSQGGADYTLFANDGPNHLHGGGSASAGSCGRARRSARAATRRPFNSGIRATTATRAIRGTSMSRSGTRSGRAASSKSITRRRPTRPPP